MSYSYFDDYDYFPELKLEEIKQRDMQVEKKETAEEEEARYFLMSLHSDHAYAEAKKENNVVVLPEENQLLLDIDSPEAEAVYNKNKSRFITHIAVIINEERKTSRGGNTHIYVTLDRNIDKRERVLFQLFLGSDPTREMLSQVRIEHNDPHPTLFIEKPTLLLGDGQ
jgi:hypothetical protein